MRRKARKKIRKSILLSLLCLLIVLPNGVLANIATADETTTPLLENTEQVEVDATQPEVEPTPAPTDEATPVTELETVVEEPTAPEATEQAVEPTEPAANLTGPSESPVVPETEQVNPEATPAQAAAIPAAVDDEGEETWPEIGDVTFSPRDAKVGDMVTVTAKILDGTAIEETVREVVMYMRAPNTNWQYSDGQIVRLRYDSDDDQWIGFFIVQETWNPGYWDVELEATYTYEAWNDYYGDEDFEYSDWTYKEIQFAFNVLNTGDSTPPQAIELTASPNPVNAGQTVSFAATLKDVNNQSDIVYALLQLDHDSRDFEVLRYYEEIEYIPLTLDNATGKWVGTYTVPGNVPDGTEVYYSIVLADRAGNIMDQYYYRDEHYFVVENQDGDVTAPELTGVIVPEDETSFLVTEEIGAVNIPIEAIVVDDKSGVKSVTAEVEYNGSGRYAAAASQEIWEGSYKYHTTQLNYNSETERYVGSVEFTADDPAGYYTVYITAEDNNGNIETYYGTEFELENPDTDWLAPDIQDFDVIGDPVKFGDVMKINAKVTDENPGAYSSGVHSVMAEIYYDSTGDWEEIELILNPVTGRYEADYSIKYNDVFVVVFVYAIDNSGNYSESNREIVEIYNLDDYLPPYIDFVKYPPATLYQGEVARFETRLVDEGTGIHSATITLINVMDIMNYSVKAVRPSREMAVAQSLQLTFNSAKGVWETDWLIPTDSPTGLFLVNLTVFDNVGNKRDIINDGGFGNIPQTLVILPKPAVVGAGTVTPTPVNNPTTPVVIPVTTPTKTATELPDTATNNFNLLFAGLALVVIGGSRFVFRRKVDK